MEVTVLPLTVPIYSFSFFQSLLHPANGADGVIMDHPEQRPAQRRALADALISKVNFLINLEGEAANTNKLTVLWQLSP